VVGLLGGFFVLGGILGLLGTAKHGGHGDGAVALLIGAVVVGIAVWWLAHGEHRLRMIRSGVSEERPPAAAARVSGPRHRSRLAPALMLAISVGSLVAAVSEYGQGRRSSDVQQHGIRAPGTVTGVTVSSHCARIQCTYTSTLRVALASRLSGRGSTTVHVDGYSAAYTGEPITVLVDRHDTSYAELPGQPFSGAELWIAFLAIALGFGVLTARLARQAWRVRTPVSS
jgi:hypothetical protein